METYFWETDYFHPNNDFTMQDYLNNHLHDGFTMLVTEGSYAEIQKDNNGLIYAVHASGDGNSFCHKVEFVLLSIN